MSDLTFAQLGLPADLVTTLARRGMHAPFAIQAAALPDALAGRDVLGRAQTGSGKTLAFGLPLITRLVGRPVKSRRPLGLVLVPTRELAFQVVDALAPLGQPIGVSVTSVVGGAPFGKQVTALSRGTAIVVATPGRLEDHILQGTCSLEDVEIAVLDEADHMCDLGFLPAVKRILDQVKPKGQRMLFSATLDAAVKSIVEGYLADAVTHSTMSEGQPVADVDHHVFVVHPGDKTAVTAEIAGREGKTMLFVRTQHGADRLATQLGRFGVGASSLHGGKTQAQRNKALDAFKHGKVRVLVATDVAARGIHVDDVDLVLHVDPAADHKDYLHRAGRTARAGAAGTVVTLTTPSLERTTMSLMKRAGVDATSTRIRPGNEALASITGAVPVSADAVPFVPEVQTARPERAARDGQRPARTAQRPPRTPRAGDVRSAQRPSRPERPNERTGDTDRTQREWKPRAEWTPRVERSTRPTRPTRADRPSTRADRGTTAGAPVRDDRPRHERRAGLQRQVSPGQRPPRAGTAGAGARRPRSA